MDSSKPQSADLNQETSFHNNAKVVGANLEKDAEINESLAKLSISNEKNNTNPTPEKENQATDLTDPELVNLRRSIYLTLMSSLNPEECAHKLRKLETTNQHKTEVCNMIIECCMQEKAYLRFYGLLCQKIIELDEAYKQYFSNAFAEKYTKVHLLDTKKLSNTANLLAHLLSMDIIDWKIFQDIMITETDSSSRIYLKHIFLQLAEIMGIDVLKKKLQDPDYQEAFKGIFPKDDTHKNLKFAIDFFTAIGLTDLTTEMRKYLTEEIPLDNQTQKEE